MVIAIFDENNNSNLNVVNNNGSANKKVSSGDEKAKIAFENSRGSGAKPKVSLNKGLQAPLAVRSKAEKKEADTRALQLAMGTTFKNAYRAIAQDMKPMRYTFFVDPEVKHRATYLLWKDGGGNVFAERLPNRESEGYRQAWNQLTDPLNGYLFVPSPI